MDAATVVELASVVGVSITAILTLYQWSGSMKIKRTEILHDLLETIRSNPEIREAWYYLEYHEGQWYNDSFHETPLEEKMDHLLSHLNYVTYLLKNRIIRKYEFQLFDYQIKSVARNPGIQCYFFNLYHFAHRNNSTFSFEYLFDYCFEMNYFNPDIKDADCGNYYVVSFNQGHCRCPCKCDCKDSTDSDSTIHSK